MFYTDPNSCCLLFIWNPSRQKPQLLFMGFEQNKDTVSHNTPDCMCGSLVVKWAAELWSRSNASCVDSCNNCSRPLAGRYVVGELMNKLTHGWWTCEWIEHFTSYTETISDILFLTSCEHTILSGQVACQQHGDEQQCCSVLPLI